MSNENYIIKDEKSYYNKCDIIKEQFLKDENFKNKKPHISQINKSLKEILFLFCNVNEDNEMIIDYRYFKLLEMMQEIKYANACLGESMPSLLQSKPQTLL